MGDCISPDVVDDFAARDVNRIVGSIAKVLARKAVYMDVLDGGTLPNVSNVVRSVVQERSVVGASLALPVFTPDIQMCGAQGTQDQVGSTEYQYQLETLRGRGPRVCVKTSRTAFKGAYIQAQMALEKGIQQLMNADIRGQLVMRSGVKFVAKTGVSFDGLITGDAQQIDTQFLQVLPDAPMNFKTLYRLGSFLREDLLADPFATSQGEFFKVICSPDQLERFRNDADVKEDLLYLTAGSFRLGEENISGYQFQGYRSFAFGVDSQPLRFNTFDGNGDPIFIEPEIGVATTNGVAARRNPAWTSALYEIMLLVAGQSFKRLVPEQYVGEGSFKFAPQLHMGELIWRYIIDNDCNLYGDFGQHIYQIERAYAPLRPQNVIPIAYRRCQFDTDLGACTTSVAGL